MRLLFAILLSTAVLTQEATPPAAPSEVATLRKQLNEALDDLAVARAQRGDCETTLAPIEAQVRRADSDRRWAEGKAALEREQPGFDCNPRTLACTKKPEPARGPEKKDHVK